MLGLSTKPRSVKKLPWFWVMGERDASKQQLIDEAELSYFTVSDETLSAHGLNKSDSYEFICSNEAMLVHFNEAIPAPEVIDSLKKTQKGKAPSAVILVIDLRNINQLNSWKMKVHEINTRFRIRITVYIVITHVESIPGFSAFIKGLSDSEREQMWCFNLDESIYEQYKRLSRLRSRLITVHEDPVAVSELLRFPGQWLISMHSVLKNISMLREENPYLEPAYIKSVFLTATEGENSYFMRRILKNLTINPENHQPSQWFQRQSQAKRLCLLLTPILIIVIVLLSAPYSSYIRLNNQGSTLSSDEVDRLYQPLIHQLIEENGVYHINDLMPDQVNIILTSSKGIPVVFTKKSIRSLVLPAIKSLAYDQKGINHSVLMSSLCSAYLRDYVAAWKVFLQGVTLKKPRDQAQLSAMIAQLSKQDNQIERLIHIVSEQLSVKDHEKLKPNFSSSEIDKFLIALRQQWSALDQELIALGESDEISLGYHVYAQKVLSSEQHAVLNQLYDQLQDSLSHINHETRVWLEPILTSPYHRTWEIILQGAAQHIQNTWQDTMMPFYNAHFQDSFPISRSKSEVSLQHIVAFFKPIEGMLSRYFNEQLSGYMTLSNEGLQLKRWLGQGLPVSAEFMASLSQGLSIRDALFYKQADTPSFTFSVTAIPYPGIEKITFEHGGIQYLYRNEPEFWHTFNWSSAEASVLTGLSATLNGQEDYARHEFDGLWGLFRLFSTATLHKISQDEYLAKWVLVTDKGKKWPVTLKVKSEHSLNTFIPYTLLTFSLPTSIYNKAGELYVE